MKNKIFFAVCFTLMLLVNCDSKPEAPNNPSHIENERDSESFYDFSFSIDIMDERHGVVENIYYNEFLTKNKDSCYIQHSVFFNEANKEKYRIPKTQTIKVSTAKMDSIYNIISNTLTPKYGRNKSTEKIPKIKSYDDEWKTCKIKLDLKFRGNIYETHTYSYQEIYKYILENSDKVDF